MKFMIVQHAQMSNTRISKKPNYLSSMPDLLPLTSGKSFDGRLDQSQVSANKNPYKITRLKQNNLRLHIINGHCQILAS